MKYYQPRYGEDIYKKVRWHLFHYEEIKEAVYYARRENVTKAGYPQAVREGYMSNPTETEAIRNLTPLKKIELKYGGVVHRPEEWLYVIEEVVENLEHFDKKITKQTFFEGKRWSRVIEDNHIEKNSFYRHKERCVALVAIKAAERGLISLQKNK